MFFRGVGKRRTWSRAGWGGKADPQDYESSYF
jgi:hypothetical protein